MNKELVIKMLKKRILICGASGQLGQALINIFSKNKAYDAYGLSRNGIGTKHLQCDISNFDKLEEAFRKIKPDVVINSAAYANADLCEKNKGLAYKINYLGNKNVLELSKKYDSYFVFISSYYVFDGAKKFYSEDAEPTPINYYGVTKTMSEIVTGTYRKSLIIRASKIFSLGYDDRNFIARTYQSLANGQKVLAVDDQYNNPIHADLLAKSIMELIDLERLGIYNIGGKDYVSNYGLAKSFARFFGLDHSLIKSIKTKESGQATQRPRHVYLKIDKLRLDGIGTHRLKYMFKLLNPN